LDHPLTLSCDEEMGGERKREKGYMVKKWAAVDSPLKFIPIRLTSCSTVRVVLMFLSEGSILYQDSPCVLPAIVDVLM